MENFTLTSPYYHLAVLFSCFILFKISMSAIHPNPLKMPIIYMHEGLLYFLNIEGQWGCLIIAVLQVAV